MLFEVTLVARSIQVTAENLSDAISSAKEDFREFMDEWNYEVHGVPYELMGEETTDFHGINIDEVVCTEEGPLGGEEGLWTFDAYVSLRVTAENGVEAGDKALRLIKICDDPKAFVEELVVSDYKAVDGKVILAEEVYCGSTEGDCDWRYFNPPLIAKILHYDERGIDQDVKRWMDKENCDPIYDVRILESHPDFPDAKNGHVYGISRSTDGKVDPPRFVVASDDIQEKYKSIREFPVERQEPLTFDTLP